ncbi:hypothetical protein C0992_003115, partial [Termitomyces sp. T32_za158]
QCEASFHRWTSSICDIEGYRDHGCKESKEGREGSRRSCWKWRGFGDRAMETPSSDNSVVRKNGWR